MTHQAPTFAPGTATTTAQKRGKQYERKALVALEEVYAHELVPHPWFYYQDRFDHPRWCQPDALLIRPYQGKITIIEIKLRHTADAYHQLFELYLPIVKWTFGPQWKYSCCEVVRWYDAAEKVPEPARLCNEPDLANPGVFGVYICRT